MAAVLLSTFFETVESRPRVVTGLPSTQWKLPEKQIPIVSHAFLQSPSNSFCPRNSIRLNGLCYTLQLVGD